MFQTFLSTAYHGAGMPTQATLHCLSKLRMGLAQRCKKMTVLIIKAITVGKEFPRCSEILGLILDLVGHPIFSPTPSLYNMTGRTLELK